MKTEPNEPAFLRQEAYYDGELCGVTLGLTKREHIASILLGGMLANTDRTGFDNISAVNAVKLADKLIEELNKC